MCGGTKRVKVLPVEEDIINVDKVELETSQKFFFRFVDIITK